MSSKKWYNNNNKNQYVKEETAKFELPMEYKLVIENRNTVLTCNFFSNLSTSYLNLQWA